MVATPWGDSTTLRERRLRPGPGEPAEDVARNQRERLFAALVATVADRGYGATRVADLVEASGVSTRSFYALFPDKEALLLACAEEILAVAVTVIGEAALGSDEGEAVGVERAAELLRDHPAAARLCLLEAPGAGPLVRRRLEEMLSGLEGLAGELAARHGGPVPREILAGRVGGLLGLARVRLLQGREEELPALFAGCAAIFGSYEMPAQPLRPLGRGPAPSRRSPEGHDHADRAVRALGALVLDHDLSEVVVEDVLRRASMSAGTFYANFSGKEDLLGAAIEDSGAQLLAATLPAYRRMGQWGPAVRAGIGAFLAFLSFRPEIANLLLVCYGAGGAAAIERRAAALAPLEELFEAGRLRRPDAPAPLGEAMLACLLSMASDRFLAEGSRGLPALAPLATHVLLSPFLGSEAASQLANSESGARTLAAQAHTFRRLTGEPASARILALLERRHLALRPSGVALRLGAEEVAAELGISTGAAEAELDALIGVGILEAPEPGTEGGPPRYLSRLRYYETEEWASIPRAERSRISTSILDVIGAEIDLASTAGSFDARHDRHLVRFRAEVDERGWAEIGAIYDEAAEALEAAVARAGDRLAAGSERPIEARAVQMFFEMPGGG